MSGISDNVRLKSAAADIRAARDLALSGQYQAAAAVARLAQGAAMAAESAGCGGAVVSRMRAAAVECSRAAGMRIGHP